MNLVKKDFRTGTHSGPNEIQSPFSLKSVSFLKILMFCIFLGLTKIFVCVQVQGNMGLAMKLQEFQKKAPKSKL